MKIIVLLLTAAMLTMAGVVARFIRDVCVLARRVEIAEKALGGVKPLLDDMPRIQNEVRDMRETLDRLPLDELQAAADYDKALMDGLENIANYSISEAMKTRGDGG